MCGQSRKEFKAVLKSKLAILSDLPQKGTFYCKHIKFLDAFIYATKTINVFLFAIHTVILWKKAGKIGTLKRFCSEFSLKPPIF